MKPLRTIAKAAVAIYITTAVIVVCAASIHAAAVTIPAYPAPPATQQPGKGHQAIGRPPDIVLQVLQPLWITDTAEVDKPGEIYTLTGYCPCITCCGIWSAEHPSRQGTDYQQLTASGTVPTAGRTCGADWATLPAGTTIEIEGYGRRVVEDKPAAWVVDKYCGKIIDLYFDSHAEAAAVGKQEVMVWTVTYTTD